MQGGHAPSGRPNVSAPPPSPLAGAGRRGPPPLEERGGGGGPARGGFPFLLAHGGGGTAERRASDGDVDWGQTVPAGMRRVRSMCFQAPRPPSGRI